MYDKEYVYGDGYLECYKFKQNLDLVESRVQTNTNFIAEVDPKRGMYQV
jgi:hypothetical protein